MEEALKVDQEMPLVEVKSEPEENIDSNSESEREEIELKSPRGRRRIARDAHSIKKEIEEEKTEDKLKDDTENKDVVDDYETAEKKENELLLGRKNTPKQLQGIADKLTAEDQNKSSSSPLSQISFLEGYNVGTHSFLVKHKYSIFVLRIPHLMLIFT